MRLVHLLVPSGELDTVTGILDDEGVDCVVTDERSREGARIVEFPIPGGAVETVLDALRNAGVDDGTYTVIANAETANTEQFAELEERYVEGSEEDDSVAHEEVRSKARSLLPDRRSYYVMTALSAIVATAGLLLDAAAVVIGSMAIAAAVVPAAAAVGIGAVWALPTVALGAATLLVVNTASIVLAGTGTLWYLGYRPDGWTPGDLRANIGRQGTVALLVTVVVLLAFFAVPTSAMVEHVGVENTANGAVQDTLERPEYRDLTLPSVTAEFGGLGLLSSEREVNVVVERPADRNYPGLAADIGRTLQRRTGTNVSVTIEFVERAEFRSADGTS